MVSLYVLAVGGSGEGGGRLNRAERKDIRALARVLCGFGVSPDRIVSGPSYIEAEARSLVAEMLPGVPDEADEGLVPGASIERLVQALGRHAGRSVLWIAPDAAACPVVSTLISGTADVGIDLGTAALCQVEFASLVPARCATLVVLMGPHAFRRSRRHAQAGGVTA